jgi:hypothetical protein
MKKELKRMEKSIRAMKELEYRLACQEQEVRDNFEPLKAQAENIVLGTIKEELKAVYKSKIRVTDLSFPITVFGLPCFVYLSTGDEYGALNVFAEILLRPKSSLKPQSSLVIIDDTITFNWEN